MRFEEVFQLLYEQLSIRQRDERRSWCHLDDLSAVHVDDHRLLISSPSMRRKRREEKRREEKVLFVTSSRGNSSRRSRRLRGKPTIKGTGAVQ